MLPSVVSLLLMAKRRPLSTEEIAPNAREYPEKQFVKEPEKSPQAMQFNICMGRCCSAGADTDRRRRCAERQRLLLTRKSGRQPKCLRQQSEQRSSGHDPPA